jgi:aspartyl aminopeptidase
LEKKYKEAQVGEDKMKLTKEKLIEIIKEEYQNILNEKTVRLGSMDINFQSSDQAQLVGMKGRLPVSKMDIKGLLGAIGKEFGIR